MTTIRFSCCMCVSCCLTAGLGFLLIVLANSPQLLSGRSHLVPLLLLLLLPACSALRILPAAALHFTSFAALYRCHRKFPHNRDNNST
jgi:hypothetical protein